MRKTQTLRIGLLLTVILALAVNCFAVTPTVKVVSFDPNNTSTPHDTYPGKIVTLKGTSDVAGPTIQATWDFGDGSPVATFTVTDAFNVAATHLYSGPTGTIFPAKLTIQDTSSGGGSSFKMYYVAMRALSQQAQVNVAIDEGLWFLHKTMHRYTSGVNLVGDWVSSCPYSSNACQGYYGTTASNIQAFEINGYLETGSANEPYTDTVARGMKVLFSWLTSGTISPHTVPIANPPSCTVAPCPINPDGNGNGIAVYVNQSYPFYQGGMFMDAIVASQTPAAIAPTGPANVIGRTYKDIVQDMVDGYMNCQYASSGGGGWRYNCGDFPDNSACQWAAIGIIAAVQGFGAVVPPLAMTWNQSWLNYSFYNLSATEGTYGYTGPNSFAWGPYATTPSGLVQLVMNHIGRGNPLWDKAESFLRDHFNDYGSGYNSNNSLKSYYYGLLSFTKAMLLHDPGGVLTPITSLQSQTTGVLPIDWYGDPVYGIAHQLITDQAADGSWYDTLQVNSGNQWPFSTAFAIIMLRKQVFVSCVSNLKGVPKAAGAQPAKVTLVWSAQSGANFYTVLRGNTSGGPYTTNLGTTNTVIFQDSTVSGGTTYYYVIQPSTSANGVICQSNETAVTVPLP